MLLKSEMLTFIQELACNRADAGAISVYYDEEVIRIAKELKHLVTSAIIPVVNGTEEYEIPEEIIEPIGFYYDGKMLFQEDLMTVHSAYGSSWRTLVGTPRVYIRDEQDARTIRLVPIPDRSMDQSVPIVFYDPFGMDLPSGALVVIGTQDNGELQEWLRLPVAFAVLTREFARESHHQDDKY